MKNRERQRANKKLKQAEKKIEIGTKDNGYSDLTPYNAVTGEDKISISIPTELKTRVRGNFNG